MNEELKKAEEKVKMGINSIFIGMVILGFIIISTSIYGLCAHYLIIPEYKAKVSLLEQKASIQKEIINKLEKETDNLKMQVRWSTFLELMLDKGTKVQFDNVEKYLKKNKNGLYNTMAGK